MKKYRFKFDEQKLNFGFHLLSTIELKRETKTYNMNRPFELGNKFPVNIHSHLSNMLNKVATD